MTLGIAGVGLIGGSIALAARHADPERRIIGADLAETAADAKDAGLIDDAIDADAPDAADRLAACDLIVLAAPVSANLAWLDRLAAAGTTALITDTGGTKRQMMARAAGLPELAVIGGHPMAGSERCGFLAADPGLFEGRRWFLTPLDGAPAQRVAALDAFVRGFGAVPTVVDADAHDRVMAAVSALPQVTASALMAVVGERVDDEGLLMSGPGLVDTTRLAGSAATWMTDGLAHNAREVADAIDALIVELRALRDQLETPERARDLFARAQAWRQTLVNLSKK
jgi:prephenate dehydrogenase